MNISPVAPDYDDYHSRIAIIISILTVGIGLGGLLLRVSARIDRLEDQQNKRFTRLEEGQIELRERMARVEGLLEGLREAIGNAVRRVA